MFGLPAALRRDPLTRQLRAAAEALDWPLPPAAALRPLLARGGLLALSRGGERAVIALGVPPGGVCELASVTKPFTAALADAVIREGALDWETPLAALGGPLRAWPRHLTPLALATHTGGVPPHPARAALTALTQFHGPYASLSPEAALASVRRWTPPVRPGQTPRFAYSNLGAGALALALAYAAGEGLSAAGAERALRRLVTGPLGLGTVSTSPDPARAVRPAGPLGSGEATRFGELLGAGGLWADAPDLLRFGEAHLSGEAGEHWKRVLCPPGGPPGQAGVAPGWFVAPGGVWWHDGLARGSRSALGFSPDRDRVAALLVRGGPSPRTRQNVPALLLSVLGASG